MAGMFGGAKISKYLDIKLDSPFVVFYGDHEEAEPVTLSGTLILDTPAHMSVKSIKIRLEGKWKVSWILESANAPTQYPQSAIRDKGTLVSEEHIIFPSSAHVGSTHRVAPGRHEWRFKFVMNPSLPESVEGLEGNCIVYNLIAEIDRGYMSKALQARKHVRIIRTLSRDMTDTMPFPYSNEDTWTDKIKYHIYIPSRYFAFGTSIPVDFTLIPLKKGIGIGKIKMEILERLGLETGSEGDEHYATTLQDKIVASVEEQMPPNSSRQLIEPTTGIADDSYHFRVVLSLKKSLNSCRQSVNTRHIKVYHNLKIYVNIHNPDGHISQLCLRNLIHLYISPHTPINDDQSITTPITAIQNALANIDDAFDAQPPPTYGTHVLDQLYEDIDMSGFMSGITTPYQGLSRSASSENLGSFFGNSPDPGRRSRDQSESGSTRSSTSIPDSTAIQLQTRLQALRDRRPSISSVAAEPTSTAGPDSTHSSPRLDPQIMIDPPASSSHQQQPLASSTAHQPSALLHRRSRPVSSTLRHSVHHLTPPLLSEAFAAPSRYTAPPTPLRFDLGELNRTPSYNTAIQAPPPADASPDSEGLPSYDFACSVAGAAAPVTPPTPPADADDVPAYRYIPPPPTTGNSAPSTPPLASDSSIVRPATGLQHGGRLNAPLPAHVRGRSVGAVPAQVLEEAETAQRRRAGVTIGGGSLHGLWSGMRRGSQ